LTPIVGRLVAWSNGRRPLPPLASFTNVNDPSQTDAMWTLANQAELQLLLDDEHLVHRLRKRATFAGAALREVLDRAEELHERIAPDAYDFDAANVAVLEVTSV
jgi:hypothetical protein